MSFLDNLWGKSRTALGSARSKFSLGAPLADDASKWAKGSRLVKSPLGKTLGAGVAGAPFVWGGLTDDHDGSMWDEIASGASGGALMGARFGGGWGALAGGVIGAGLGAWSPFDEKRTQAPAGPTNVPMGTLSGGSLSGGGNAPGLSARYVAPESVSTDRFEKLFGQATAERNAAIAGLDATYQQQLGQLRSSYDFSETAREKSALATMIDDLHAQRAYAEGVINTQYTAAIAGTDADIAGVEADKTKAVKATDARYAASAKEAGEIRKASQSGASVDSASLGMNAAGAAQDANAQNQVADTKAAGNEAASSMARIHDITKGSLQEQSTSLKGEKAAASGEAVRLAQGLIAGTRADHDQQVNARIAAERQAYASNAAQLGSQYMSTKTGLQAKGADDKIALAQMLAGIADGNVSARNAARQSYEDRRFQAADANRAYRLKEAEAGISGPGLSKDFSNITRAAKGADITWTTAEGDETTMPAYVFADAYTQDMLNANSLKGAAGAKARAAVGAKWGGGLAQFNSDQNNLMKLPGTNGSYPTLPKKG